jgi:hypothetical protein
LKSFTCRQWKKDLTAIQRKRACRAIGRNFRPVSSQDLSVWLEGRAICFVKSCNAPSIVSMRWAISVGRRSEPFVFWPWQVVQYPRTELSRMQGWQKEYRTIDFDLSSRLALWFDREIRIKNWIDECKPWPWF